jgi:hypothetical protein
VQCTASINGSAMMIQRTRSTSGSFLPENVSQGWKEVSEYNSLDGIARIGPAFDNRLPILRTKVLAAPSFYQYSHKPVMDHCGWWGLFRWLVDRPEWKWRHKSCGERRWIRPSPCHPCHEKGSSSPINLVRLTDGRQTILVGVKVSADISVVHSAGTWNHVSHAPINFARIGWCCPLIGFGQHKRHLTMSPRFGFAPLWPFGDDQQLLLGQHCQTWFADNPMGPDSICFSSKND